MFTKFFERKRRASSLFISLAGILLITAGLVLFIRNHQAPTASPMSTANAPKSDKPSQSDIDKYKVAPDLPRYIYIPAINVNKSRIMHLGTGQHGEILSPANIFDAGWFNQSAKPGQQGTMFIFGHVSSWEANGIFHDLKNLRPGDTVTIERGDGKKFSYIVTGSKTYDADKVDMGEVLSSTDPSKPGLSLMTCTGQVKPGTSDFTERYVVFASLSR